MSAGTAFVDGVLAAGTSLWRRRRRRWWGCGVLGASPVGGLAAGRCAVALVGPSVQGGGADRAAGSRHMGVNARHGPGCHLRGLSHCQGHTRSCASRQTRTVVAGARVQRVPTGSGRQRGPHEGSRTGTSVGVSHIQGSDTNEGSVEGCADARDLLAVALQEIPSYRDGVHERV